MRIISINDLPCVDTAAAELDPAAESHAKEMTDEQVVEKLPEQLRQQSLSGSLPVSLNTLRVRVQSASAGPCLHTCQTPFAPLIWAPSSEWLTFRLSVLSASMSCTLTSFAQCMSLYCHCCVHMLQRKG